MAETKKEHAPHALDELVARVGKNNPKLLEAVLEGSSNEDLVATGASIATARILTDAGRLYDNAFDFFERATPAQKRNIRGFSRALLGVAVHHADALRKLQAETAATSQENATARVVSDEHVQGTVSAALTLRDQAYKSLRDAAAGRTTLRKEVEKAFGVADPPEKLAAGLDGMANVLTTWLASDNTALETRLELANLDKPYATELTEAALAVRAAVATAAKRTSPKAMQSALDREDGVQILLLGQMIRAFEGAHDRDSTIPRLVPISTRRLFNHNTKKRAEPEAPEEEPKNG